MPRTFVDAIAPEEYARALVNILEDFSGEKQRMTDVQRAVLNILEDFSAEKERLESTQRAILNILEDFSAEKERLESTQRAILNILEDLAEEKARLERSEQTIRLSLREKEVLLKEVHHRVKNNMQVISSLLSLQAHYLTDPDALRMFRDSQNRVQSIALVHEKLYQSPNLSHVDFDEYVRALVESLFHAQGGAARGIERSIDVGGARLTIDLAIPCGLIVNELVTNSLKHAFPAGGPGTIRVRLAEREPGSLELLVQDDGVGLPAGFDRHRTESLGLDLVFTFADQIDATVDIAHRPGTTFRFRFPGPNDRATSS